jgi:hypothetical protein
MKRLFWMTSLMLLLISVTAFADTLISFFPNDGSGDNFAALERFSNGDFINVRGGTDPFFYDIFGYPPGTTLGGTTPLYLDGGIARIGGQLYDLQQIAGGILDLSPFTLPPPGGAFQFPVSISFDVPMIIIETGDPLEASGFASGYLRFSYSDFDGLYYGSQFITPEPGTLALMGTGLTGTLAFVRKRINIRS